MALVPHGAGAGGSVVSLSCPMLTGDNYTVWAIKVEANLDAQGLWEAVVPAEDAAAAIIAKKDKPARAYLLGALSEDILLQVSAKKTAAEVWASLKARFVGADRVRAARLSTLRGEFDRLIHGGRRGAGRLRRQDQRHGGEVRQPRRDARRCRRW